MPRKKNPPPPEPEPDEIKILDDRKQRLPVPLTDGEKLELGEALCELEERARSNHDRAKAVRAEIREEELDIRQLIRDNVAVQRKGHRDAEVDVQYRANFTRGMVQEVRMDTGEVVRERPMTDEERQRKLFDRKELERSLLAEPEPEPEEEEGDEE